MRLRLTALFVSALVGCAEQRTGRLSSPRRMLAATNVGPLSLFAGGFNGKQESAAVDIFDARGNFVRTDHLSQARGLVSATSLGEMAFFAGGQDHHGNKSNVIDIFNSTSGAWSTAKLSIGRSMLSAASAGDMVIFAGGELRYNSTV